MIRFFALYHKENGKRRGSETAAEIAVPPTNPIEKPADAPLTQDEILEDMLASQQQIAALYNDAAANCKAGALKNDMLTILREEHNLHTDVLTELTARGKRKPSLAPQNKIDEVKREFEEQNKG